MAQPENETSETGDDTFFLSNCYLQNLTSKEFHTKSDISVRERKKSIKCYVPHGVAPYLNSVFLLWRSCDQQLSNWSLKNFKSEQLLQFLLFLNAVFFPPSRLHILNKFQTCKWNSTPSIFNLIFNFVLSSVSFSIFARCFTAVSSSSFTVWLTVWTGWMMRSLFRLSKFGCLPQQHYGNIWIGIITVPLNQNKETKQTSAESALATAFEIKVGFARNMDMDVHFSKPGKKKNWLIIKLQVMRAEGNY